MNQVKAMRSSNDFVFAYPGCDNGLSLCFGSCTSLASDESNCGACGTVCGAAQKCNGQCTDSTCCCLRQFVDLCPYPWSVLSQSVPAKRCVAPTALTPARTKEIAVSASTTATVALSVKADNAVCCLVIVSSIHLLPLLCCLLCSMPCRNDDVRFLLH